MQLTERMEVLKQLQSYMLSNDWKWEAEKEKAYRQNGWFIPGFIDLAVRNVATHLLSSRNLGEWTTQAGISEDSLSNKTVGIVMPGNLPLAGFQDFVLTFVSGHRQRIKLSPVDEVLLKHLVSVMIGINPKVEELISVDEMLKGCDAYITTNASSSPVMLQYLEKYPTIIHEAVSTSALLYGSETRQQLESLADDVFQYFGQGWLSVKKLYVPHHYDFIPMLKVFDKYSYLIDHNKYKNNYDYQLSLLILNKKFYMTNGCLLLTENAGAFAPAGRLNFEYYSNPEDVIGKLAENPSENLVGTSQSPFGRAQQSVLGRQPALKTLQFLRNL